MNRMIAKRMKLSGVIRNHSIIQSSFLVPFIAFHFYSVIQPIVRGDATITIKRKSCIMFQLVH